MSVFRQSKRPSFWQQRDVVVLAIIGLAAAAVAAVLLAVLALDRSSPLPR